MITIKKAASLTGLSVKAIRHYESCGLMPKPERSGAGYRMYSESDIARLQQIRYFREMKFPLTDIAALLDAPAEEMQTALIRQQAEVDRVLEEYKRAQMLLQSVLPEDIDAAALSAAPDVCRSAIVATDLQNDILEGGVSNSFSRSSGSSLPRRGGWAFRSFMSVTGIIRTIRSCSSGTII